LSYKLIVQAVPIITSVLVKGCPLLVELLDLQPDKDKVVIKHNINIRKDLKDFISSSNNIKF